MRREYLTRAVHLPGFAYQPYAAVAFFALLDDSIAAHRLVDAFQRLVQQAHIHAVLKRVLDEAERV